MGHSRELVPVRKVSVPWVSPLSAAAPHRFFRGIERERERYKSEANSPARWNARLKAKQFPSSQPRTKNVSVRPGCADRIGKRGPAPIPGTQLVGARACAIT